MTIAEALIFATKFLEKHSIEDASLEAEILLCHVLALNRASLITHNQQTIEPQKYETLKHFLFRRAQHEPSAYIIGKQPFMSLDFFVDHSVLIPRPETEQLVEVVLRVAGHESQVMILDVGTGSGAIAVSLAKYLPYAKIMGIDSSEEAIKMAQKNAEYHKVSDRCQFIVGNVLEPLKNVGAAFMAARNKWTVPIFDLIVSNPPYIPTSEIENLQAEVKNWEPRQALDGGKDGLFYLRKLIEEGPKLLKKGGYLILEFGQGQAPALKKLARGTFKKIEILKDFSQKDRIFCGQI